MTEYVNLPIPEEQTDPITSDGLDIFGTGLPPALDTRALEPSNYALDMLGRQNLFPDLDHRLLDDPEQLAEFNGSLNAELRALVEKVRQQLELLKSFDGPASSHSWRSDASGVTIIDLAQVEIEIAQKLIDGLKLDKLKAHESEQLKKEKTQATIGRRANWLAGVFAGAGASTALTFAAMQASPLTYVGSLGAGVVAAGAKLVANEFAHADTHEQPDKTSEHDTETDTPELLAEALSYITAANTQLENPSYFLSNTPLTINMKALQKRVGSYAKRAKTKAEKNDWQGFGEAIDAAYDKDDVTIDLSPASIFLRLVDQFPDGIEALYENGLKILLDNIDASYKSVEASSNAYSRAVKERLGDTARDELNLHWKRTIAEQEQRLVEFELFRQKMVTKKIQEDAGIVL